MRYLYRRGQRVRMHIQYHSPDGSAWNTSLCGQVIDPVTMINAPFTMGKGVCRHCLAVQRGERKGFMPSSQKSGA